MNEEQLVEELAKEMYYKFCREVMGEEAYEATYGHKIQTWEEYSLHNKDDYRALARIAIEYLKNKTHG